jgi:excisionase family DNA binding protein
MTETSVVLERIEAELQAIRARLEQVLEPSPGRAVYSLAEAAKRLGVSASTLRRMVRSGELLTVPVGKTPKVPATELARVSAPRRTASMPEKVRPVSRTVARGQRSAEAAKAAALVAARRKRLQR